LKLNCIKCGCAVENWDDVDPDTIQPIGGTVFRTYGHYGSSVFDPMDGTYMEIVVYDECLRDNQHTYQSVDNERKRKFDRHREEMDKLIDLFLEDDA